MGYQIFPAATVNFQSANRLSKGERKTKFDFSSLYLLAEAASLVSGGKLSLAAPFLDRDDEKKVAVMTTNTFGSIGIGWTVKKKRSPRARRLTIHPQKSSSGPFVVVQNNKQEPSRVVAEYCKNRSRTFDSSETQELGRVSKKPKRAPKMGLAALIGPSELPTDMSRGQSTGNAWSRYDTRGGEDTATDMSRGQSRLSIPNKQTRQGFLSEEEIRILNRKKGIKVSLIELCLEVSHGLQLKKWNYTSKKISYMLTERWNAVAHAYTRNELMKDIVIQLWSFTVDGSLWFYLRKVEAPTRQWKGCL